MSFAFLFPGQGSQSLNMMAGFECVNIVKETFKEASDILAYDLWKLITGDDIKAINKTIVTQPLVLTASIAIYRAYKELGGSNPLALAGHSLGEYSALVAANSLDFKDAVKLVEYRAQLMQDAVPEGKGLMAAILGLNENTVIDICKQASSKGVVEAVNFNTPEQIVIAGEREAVLYAMDLAREKNAKAISLPVSVPSHCSLMKKIADDLKARLDTISIKKPEIDVINNVDAKIYKEPDLIKDALVRQIYSPVKWTKTINKIYELHIKEIVECAPSKVIIGLVRKINKAIQTLSFTSIENIKSFIERN